MSSGEPRSAEPRLRPLPAPPAERRSVRLAPRARALAALRAIDRREVGLWVAAAALTSIVLVPVLRLWRADLSVPFDYGLDAKFGLMVVKAITDHGWYQPNSSVGAPYGQQLYDFPLGPDHVNFALVKLMTLFTSDAPAVFNLFYLLSFPMTAFASVVVLRRLGLSRGSALVASVLFAFLPYHFFKGERHLLLAAYTAVPVGCLLLLRQLRGEPLP